MAFHVFHIRGQKLFDLQIMFWLICRLFQCRPLNYWPFRPFHVTKSSIKKICKIYEIRPFDSAIVRKTFWWKLPVLVRFWVKLFTSHSEKDRFHGFWNVHRFNLLIPLHVSVKYLKHSGPFTLTSLNFFIQFLLFFPPCFLASNLVVPSRNHKAREDSVVKSMSSDR